MVPIGTLYRGGENHIKFQAGGNETAQLKIPHCGVVTTSEKYTIAHSKHTGICFCALKWDKLPNENRFGVGRPHLSRQKTSLTLTNRGTAGGQDDTLPDIFLRRLR